MKEIWKYKVELVDYPEITMKKDAEILHFDSQAENPCLWCLVEPSKSNEKKKFRLAGTGHPIKEDNLKYIGTCQLRGGGLIFHLFELLE